MPLEEAGVHCKKCYLEAIISIEQEIKYQGTQLRPGVTKRPNSYMIKNEVSSEKIDESHEEDDEFREMTAMEGESYKSRIEAMRALQEAFKLGFHRAKVSEALKACGDCNFREPRIAKVVKENKVY